MAKLYNDKYYATEETQNKLFNKILRDLIEKHRIQELIEPSAGDGKFIKIFRSFGLPCVFIDTEPEHPDIEKMDFFDWKPKEFKRRAFIGGPPYSGILFPSFLRHCKKNKAEIIAFISPITASNDIFFKKDYRLVHSEELGPTIFLSNEGEETLVSVCINIWEREKGYYPEKTPTDFRILRDFKILVNRNPWTLSEMDYCLKMHGYAGECIEPSLNLPNQDYLGIKLVNEDLRAPFENYMEKFHENYFDDIAFHSMSNPYMSKKRFVKYLKRDFYQVA